MEEGVVTTAAEADLGSILGWGFPATGGTLSYIDTIGIRAFVAECERMSKRYGKRFKPSKWLKQRAERNEPFHPWQKAAKTAQRETVGASWRPVSGSSAGPCAAWTPRPEPPGMGLRRPRG